MSKITLKEIIEYQKGAVFKSQDYQKQGKPTQHNPHT